MWFKVERKRNSIGQKYIIRCTTDIDGKSAAEERHAKGVADARKIAEILASSLKVAATVYGEDAEGEFVYGVHETAEGAALSSDPLIRRLYAESAAASLALKDQLLAAVPEETIRGFATLAAALGYIATKHRQIRRVSEPLIKYSTLFRIFCEPGEPATLSLPANDATIAILSKRLANAPDWTWLREISGLGSAEHQHIAPGLRPERVMLNIDGETQVIQPGVAYRGAVPGGGHFMLVVQGGFDRTTRGLVLDGVGLIYREKDEAAVVALVKRLLQESNPFKNRIVLLNRDLRTVRSKISDRSWGEIIPHQQSRAELDFIAKSIKSRDALKAENLSIRRGLLLSGPTGDGKSTAIECFINDIAGYATIIIVESVEKMRAVYHLAQMLAPAVVILEDLDLITKARENPYAAVSKDDVTGELLQVLSGGSAYNDVITIATTNHPEAIDEALTKRAGRFDAHIRMGYPSDDEKQRILDLYLDRFGVSDDFTRRRLQQVLSRDFGRLQLVPAHIEEFVKAGVKRARLAHRPAEYQDFEPGIEATKSIATMKPAAAAGVG